MEEREDKKSPSVHKHSQLGLEGLQLSYCSAGRLIRLIWAVCLAASDLELALARSSCRAGQQRNTTSKISYREPPTAAGVPCFEPKKVMHTLVRFSNNGVAPRQVA